MLNHHDQLYRLAELPAFIEEALSNVSLGAIIYAHLNPRVASVRLEMDRAVCIYAEQWVDDWMARNQPNLWADKEDEQDPEMRAIEAGVAMFSNPDCKAGLP